MYTSLLIQSTEYNSTNSKAIPLAVDSVYRYRSVLVISKNLPFSILYFLLILFLFHLISFFKEEYEIDLPLIAVIKISINSLSLIVNCMSLFVKRFKLLNLYMGQIYCIFNYGVNFILIC